MTRHWVLAGAVMLAGCAALSGPPERLTAGAVVEQQKPVTVPQGRSVVRLQDGRIGLDVLIAWRSPYCELHVAGPADRERVLAPRRHVVERVRYDTLIGASLPRRIAALRPAGEIGDTSEHALFQITLTFATSEEGGLRSMVCALRDDLRDGRYPTIDQLQATMSPYFRLQPSAG